jgi:hypothetical protein
MRRKPQGLPGKEKKGETHANMVWVPILSQMIAFSSSSPECNQCIELVFVR